MIEDNDPKNFVPPRIFWMISDSTDIDESPAISADKAAWSSIAGQSSAHPPNRSILRLPNRQG